MRSTTVVSLLVAGLALLSQSPAAYAAPVPNNVVSSTEKRQCQAGACKFVTSPDTDTASQSVQGLVSALISALETYQAQNTPPTFNSTADFAAPEEDTGAEPEPVIDAIELADAGL